MPGKVEDIRAIVQQRTPKVIDGHGSMAFYPPSFTALGALKCLANVSHLSPQSQRILIHWTSRHD